MKLSRRDFIAGASIFAIIAGQPELAEAWFPHGYSVTQFNGGKSQVNFNFLQGGGEFPFINKLKEAQNWSWADNTTIDALTPDLFDTNGYPVASTKFTTHGGVKTVCFIPSQTEYPGDYVLDWTGGGTVILSIAAGGGTITTVSGSATSSPWRVTLTTATELTVGITAVGPTNMRLYNINDQTALNTGQIWGAKFLARLRQANFGVLRFLNWQAGNITNVSNWNTAQRPTAYYNYNSSQYRSDLLGNLAGSGLMSNSGADYTVSAPSAFSTSGGLPADKSMVHAVWNASSPTSATITFAGGGSPNITWTSHGLQTSNQIYFTTTGSLPSGITASSLGVLPSIYYFVTVVDANTLNISATSGGSVINFATTGSGTTTGRTNVTLNVGSTAAVQVLSAVASQLTVSGNSFPVGGSSNSLSTLVYDAQLNAWLNQGGTIGPGGIQNGVPLSLCINLCTTVGAHPWFVSPPLACTPMSDWHTQLAALVQSLAPSWMIPRYEGPNELWNTAGGFNQTDYAISIAQSYGWGNDFQNWYGKAMSTIGQAVASAYGVLQANVKTQTKYQVICAMQTTVQSSTANTASSAPRLTSAKYVLQSPQSPYTASAASGWVTHVCGSNYNTPSWYGRNQEVVTAFAYYVTNSGNPTAQAANAATYEATIADGFVCTFTNGSPGTVNAVGNGLAAGQIINLITTGAMPGISPGNFWVVTPGDSFTISSTDPNNGGTTLVNMSGTASGTSYCCPNGSATINAFYVYAQNIAALGAANGVNRFCNYEGGYSPDYSTNSVTTSITAATNTTNCVFTMPTTVVQSIRSPTAQQNATNSALVAGMTIVLSGLPATNGWSAFNGQKIQVTSVSGASITTNLDASSTTGALSGAAATGTLFCDSGATVPMSTALNALRAAGKNAPNLQTHTTTMYNDLVSITGAEFPSCYQMGGANNDWSVLDPDIYVSTDPPQWLAFVAFN